ncbi:hypothetical protein [Marinobacterium jannaschii]|uniref:hypothetical protein n=1 Tax=Marinobacterium jannaschii TaxID=64970 RepID=UPI0004834496|nr:hypothetical protein [Marinobacterium jannaschii]
MRMQTAVLPAISLFCSLLYSHQLMAAELIQERQYRCAIGGCEVRCRSHDGWSEVREAQEVSMEIYSGGVIIIDLRHRFGDNQTIIVSGDAAFCKIDNHK